MGSDSVVLLIITFVCLCVVLAGIVAGGVGHSWWKYDISGNSTSFEVGLWKTCLTVNSRTHCIKHPNVLQFKKFRKDFDVVLVLLCGAGFFAVFALLSSACMFGYQRSPEAWLFGATLVAIGTLFAGGAGIAAVVYAELDIKWSSSSIFGKTEHGWSVIAAWIGSILSVLSFLLSLVLIYLTPSNRKYGESSQQLVYSEQNYAMQ